MTTEAGSATDRDNVSAEEVVTYLQDAGDHPLMYSFPQGAIFAFDRDLRYLSAGGHGLADVGLSREILEGKSIFEAFPEATAAVIEPHYRAALEGTTTTWDVPYEGHIYSQRLAPVADAGGTVVAGIGFTQDVTAARATERALRESEQQNRLTFEHAPIGQAIVELDGTWRQVNAAVTSLLGYTSSQLLEMTFQDITHPEDLDLDLGLLNQLVAGDIANYQIEKRYFTAAGHIVWVLLSVALVRHEDTSPSYFISQIQDITERKRQHQALQDLTAMLAHDLRTPAAVILGLAELMETSPGADAQVVAGASRITAVANSMTELLGNALTAAALGAGQLVASPTEVQLQRSVAAAVPTLDLGSASIDTSGLGDLTAWVDPVHLNQVFANLLTNAAKYGGDTIVISAFSDQDRVSLSVADNGRGVEPDFVQHLFDRFSRSAAARDERKPGTGLGLYIVRDLLAANDATIRYAPCPSGGAQFTISLCAPPGTPATGGS